MIRRARENLLRNEPHTPSYLGKCWGREEELQWLEQWFLNSRFPLATLTGPSGIGKTHLACEIVRNFRARGRPCVYVNLTLIKRPDQILGAIFHTLNVPFSEMTLWQRLLNRIFREDTLLVLDDFDRLLPGGALWVQDILEAAPTLKILATSQKKLGLAGEQVLMLSPLPTPPPNPKVRSLDELRAYPSAAVLLEQVGSSGVLADVSPTEVARLCRDLQGRPGWLVDAGLYLRAYSWFEFYRQYRAWFGLQTGAMQSLAPEAQRHRLFHALRIEEQRAVRCLSVFRETFDLGGAAAAMQKSPEQALQFLLLLEERGFIQLRMEGSSIRYQLTRIREIIPPLPEEQRDVVLQRLYAHYLNRLQAVLQNEDPVEETRYWCYIERDMLVQLLESLDRRRDAKGIAQFLDILVEACNIRPPASVLDWGVACVSNSAWLTPDERALMARPLLLGLIGAGLNERAHPIAAIQQYSPDCALEVGRFWHNIARGDRARERYIVAVMQAEHRRDRSRALLARACLAESEAVLGNLDEAERQIQEIEARYPVSRMHRENRRWFYYVAGYIHYQRGYFRRSRELYRVALTHSEGCPDVLRELSRVELEMGEYDVAYALASEALAQLLEDLADPHNPSIYALEGCLGDVCAVKGDYDDALDYHLPSLEYWQELGQPRWICWTLNRLVEIELLARDARHPWRLWDSCRFDPHALLQQAWRVIQPTYMNLPHKARTLHNLGWLAWHEQHLGEAENYLARAMKIRQRWGHEYGIARTLEILARVRFSQHRYNDARQLLQQASTIRQDLEAKPYPQLKHANLSILRRMHPR
ncbi:MAG: tetratricopeptide repeat protein [Fimbriimonadales bacterium]|nr:tetratricopeptide repeat protein [Fimbriimonadales bacterium]